LAGKTEGKEHVGKFSRRWVNKIIEHLNVCKEKAWNAFNWLFVRTNDGVFCRR